MDSFDLMPPAGRKQASKRAQAGERVEQNGEDEKDVEVRRGGQVALEARVPHARDMEEPEMGDVLSGPVHSEAW